MQFDYKEFLIDASPLDEGGRYYGRAKIYRRASAGVKAVEVKYSGDLGDYTCRFAPKHSDAFYHIACAFRATLCAHRYVAFENLIFSTGTKRRTYSYFAGLIETGEMRSAAMVHASEQSQETKTEKFQI